jgi:hypothetical protein
MGADGWLKIYDADAIDKAELKEKFFDTFAHAYMRKLGGQRIYTAYWDTEHVELLVWGVKQGEENRFDGFLLDEWEVWT